MSAKGSSNRAVSQQATAAALLNSPNGKRKQPERKTKTADARPAVTVERAEEEVTVERAEEEGDQTPYLNPFQR